MGSNAVTCHIIYWHLLCMPFNLIENTKLMNFEGDEMNIKLKSNWHFVLKRFGYYQSCTRTIWIGVHQVWDRVPELLNYFSNSFRVYIYKRTQTCFQQNCWLARTGCGVYLMLLVIGFCTEVQSLTLIFSLHLITFCSQVQHCDENYKKEMECILINHKQCVMLPSLNQFSNVNCQRPK